MLWEAGPAPYAPRNGLCGNSIDFILRDGEFEEAAAAAAAVAAAVLVECEVEVVGVVLIVAWEEADAAEDDGMAEVDCVLRFDRVRQPVDASVEWMWDSEECAVVEEEEEGPARRLACDGTIRKGRVLSLMLLLLLPLLLVVVVELVLVALLPSPPLAVSSLLVPLAIGSVCVSKGCCRCPRLLTVPLPTLLPPPSLSSVCGLLSCLLFADLRRELLLLLLLPPPPPPPPPGVVAPGCAPALTAAAAAAVRAVEPVEDGAPAVESGIFATASTTRNPLNALCAKHDTDVGRSDGDISSICDKSSIPAFVMFLHFLNESANDDVFGMSFGNFTPRNLGLTKKARLKFSGSGPNFF